MVQTDAASHNLREQIIDALARLPEESLREVRTFVDFLLSRRGREQPGASTHPAGGAPPRPLRDLLGILQVSGPPPTDAECEEILADERMRRYG
jgi:hypothetical protein